MGSIPRNPIRRNVTPYRVPAVSPEGITDNGRPAPRPLPEPQAPAPAPAPPKAPRVGLVLLIDGAGYQLDRLPREPGDGTVVGYRLSRSDGTSYDAVAFEDGPATCECGDYAWRGQDRAFGCKHLQSLRIAGLMPGPQAPAECWADDDVVGLADPEGARAMRGGAR